MRVRCSGAGVSGVVGQATVAGRRSGGVCHHGRHQRFFCRAGTGWPGVRPLGRSPAPSGQAVCRPGAGRGGTGCVEHPGNGQFSRSVRPSGKPHRPAGLAAPFHSRRRASVPDGRHASGSGAGIDPRPRPAGRSRRATLCGQHRRCHWRHAAGRLCVAAAIRCHRQCVGGRVTEPAGCSGCLAGTSAR
ncbi:hypothetical protein D3C81_822680 [compost metagenome]